MRLDSEPSAGLAECIDDRLPQTQCRRCGYPACRPYADAVARGEAEFNRCAPGGERTLRALARLLGRTPRPRAPEVGRAPPGRVALIDESACIGCALCLQACPVDAILGAPRHLHTVLRHECTGCELCLPPCPVDCIVLVPERHPRAHDERRAAHRARERYRRHCERLAREQAERTARRVERAGAASTSPADKQAVIRAAVERVRARRAARAAVPPREHRDP
ncbi:electron transport complex protein rnfB [bacterium BMS3Bbin12]|nr:electron transport complex protein rnfB [bacterium BMS3Bbin12]GBE50797.1 electron transport complex protein rnfB [bacterium BMS3Bbin13]